jgi:hypothetical protein
MRLERATRRIRRWHQHSEGRPGTAARWRFLRWYMVVFPRFVAYREERKERVKKRDERVAAARGREKGGAARVQCRGDKERGQVRCCVGGEDHGTMCVSPVLSL